jgi:arylsulfatase A-like enzyme
MTGTSIHRRGFLQFAGAASASALIPSGLIDMESERPNIVIIVADDLGWADVGFHGSEIKTPSLDALAASGLELDHHYVAPMCSPTRTALMTGRYWSRFGVTAATNDRCLPFGTATIASALKGVGYDTAITGKWHLGSLPEWGPRKFGFDHSYGSLAGGVGPYDHHYKKGPYTRTWHRDDKLIDEVGHVTDLITREAVSWIEARTSTPFFLYVPFTAPHIPIDEPQIWLERNADIADPDRRLFAGCVTHMDHGVGMILDALSRKGLRENTLILFFSDNGAIPNVRNDDPLYPGSYQLCKCGGRNDPLRGQKTQLYEGGIRTPASVSWPGRLKPGMVIAPLSVTDWMPTICRLVGYEPPQDLKWDGRDILSQLTGRETKAPERVLYWEGVGHQSSSIRKGDWKLVVQKEGDRVVELFNLAADPKERNDLKETYPDRVKELERLLAAQAARDNDSVASDRR